MKKDIGIDSTGSVSARASGDPASGGNLNNHAEVSADLRKQRVTLSAGLGAAIEKAVAGVKVIGAAGIKASAAANVGISADRAERQHDSRYDTPLAPNAIGVSEARDVINGIMRKSNGDLTKYTLSDVEDLLDRHPNIVKPSHIDRFNQGRERLEANNISGLPGVPTVSAADLLRPMTLTQINEAAVRAQDAIASAGGPDVMGAAVVSRANAALNNLITEGAEASIAARVRTIDEAAADIRRDYSQLPTQLQQIPSASRIYEGAVRVQEAIASAGGPEAIGTAVVSRVPAALTDVIQEGTQQRISEEITKVYTTAADIRRHYDRIPSQEHVQQLAKKINDVVRYDPEVSISGFAAVAVQGPSANAALVAQQAANATAWNASRVAGQGHSINPAIISSTRVEVGMGDNNLGFSDGTAQKLNLGFRGGRTAIGAYAFVEEEKVRWKGMDSASRKTLTTGVGGNISKALDGGGVGVISVEAFNARTDTVSPGNIPGKSKDKGIVVKAGMTF